MTFKPGDEVICVRAARSRRLVEGSSYTVKRQISASTITLEEVGGSYFADRFVHRTKTKEKKRDPFSRNPVQAITVPEEDVKAILAKHVSLIIGRPVKVDQIIQKFDEAVELVLGESA